MKTRTALFVALALAVEVTTLVARPAAAAEAVITTYPRTNTTIANPERGFYRQQQECQGADFNQDTLKAYRAAKFTLVMCYFILPKTTADISVEITKFNNQARIVRENGMKMILRFSYGDSQADATVNIVKAHLNALAAPLAAAAPVIFVMQSGFVGAYGEGAASDHFGTEGSYTPQNIADRKFVVTRLLEILPNSRMVQVRTPRMKRLFFGDGHPTNPASIGTRKPADRVGHHWDCYLRNAHDGGTWQEGVAESIPTQKAWLTADTNYGSLGGETCLFNPTPEIPNPYPRLDCTPNDAGETVLKEMNRLNFTFLNNDWDPRVNNTWTPSCRSTIERKLGYQIAIDSLTLPTTITRGVATPVQFVFTNTGWARPVNSRPIYIILRHTTTGAIVRASVAVNGSQIAGGGTVTTSNLKFTLPASTKVGVYNVLLSLPDPLITDSATRAAYSIQLASRNATGVAMWEPLTGYNNMARSVTVAPQPETVARQPDTTSASVTTTTGPVPTAGNGTAGSVGTDGVPRIVGRCGDAGPAVEAEDWRRVRSLMACILGLGDVVRADVLVAARDLDREAASRLAEIALPSAPDQVVDGG